jgi:leucine dehydrogenase
MDGVYRPERAKELTERIYDTLERVIAISRADDVPTNVAADRMAEHRLREVRALKRLNR